jgi:hypothetical protein
MLDTSASDYLFGHSFLHAPSLAHPHPSIHHHHALSIGIVCGQEATTTSSYVHVFLLWAKPNTHSDGTFGFLAAIGTAKTIIVLLY